MIGVKPLFSGKTSRESDKANFDVIFVLPDGKQLRAIGVAL